MEETLLFIPVQLKIRLICDSKGAKSPAVYTMLTVLLSNRLSPAPDNQTTADKTSDKDSSSNACDIRRHCVHGDGQTLNIPHRAHAVINFRK